VIVAGKGGVGKTTVAAALARAAAGQGRRVLVVTLEREGGLGPLLGLPGPLDEDLHDVPGGEHLQTRAVTASRALGEYLSDHGLGLLASRLVRSGVLDIVATAAPGIDDLLVLGKLKAFERSGQWDLIVLDAPAAGHAITFLQAPKALADAVRGGPVATQARQALEMLGDPDRCQVVLVTLAEETPINELIETAYALEDRVGVQLGPVVVNALYTAHGPGLSATRGAAALRAAAAFRLERSAGQERQLARLADSLPLPIVRLPYLRRAGLGPDDIAVLSNVLAPALGSVPA
jgi:anion-transporting  ArsA/GET3 family ATPase